MRAVVALASRSGDWAFGKALRKDDTHKSRRRQFLDEGLQKVQRKRRLTSPRECTGISLSLRMWGVWLFPGRALVAHR